MRNLLSIEEAFLNMPEVKEGLNLTEIRTLNRTMSNGQKKKFAQTLQLSVLVLKGFEWFNSDEAKQILANEGLTWTTEDFSKKVFGWGKSYFYKVVKAGKLETTIVEEFNAKCDEIEREGDEANRTLEGLLKYAKQLEQGSEASGEEGEEGDGEANGEAEAERRVKNLFTMTYKREAGNIAVRIDSNGVIKTTNSEAEILEAIAFLTSVMRAANGGEEHDNIAEIIEASGETELFADEVYYSEEDEDLSTDDEDDLLNF